MLDITKQVCLEKNYLIDVALQSDIDHLHVLVDIEPKISALQVTHQIKQISTFRIYNTIQYISLLLKPNSGKRKRFFRMAILFALAGDGSTETIQKYIEEQG
jgi:putative transposase